MKNFNDQPELSQEEVDLVITLYSNGQFQEAINKIKILNESYPNVPFLFNIIGACYKSLGQLEVAAKMFKNAVIIKPDFSEAHKNLGITLKDLGKFDDAVKSFKKSIAIEPKYLDAHYNLAVTHKVMGQLDFAVNSYKEVLVINPDFAEAHNNLGNVLKDLDQLNNAFTSYEKAIAIRPDFAEAHNNLGNVLKDLDQLTNAVTSYEKAVVIKPDFAESYYNLGVVLKQLGLLDDAVRAYKNAITIKPDFAEAHNSLGNCFTILGQMGLAIDCHEKAISIKSDFAEAHNYLGFNLLSLGKLKGATKFFENAIGINPNYAEAHGNLGNVFKKLKHLDKAMLCYENAYEVKPNMNFILGDILNNKMHLCNWNDLPSLLNKAKKRIINSERVVGPFSLLGLIDDPALQRKASVTFANYYFPESNTLPKITRYPKHSKIRIGYFSADFKVHPVAALTAELYELHNRSHFEIYAFSFGPDTKDELNLRIKTGVDHFHDVHLMPHKEIVLLARSLEIDIAVDLGGHTAKSKTDVFAMSAAPIQLSYIGYLGTMGVNYYDYLIADPIMIPEKNQKHFVEKIVYLPSFQVNDSKESSPEVTLNRKDLGLPEKGFVFCCFNNTYKFTPATFDIWARILKEVVGSVLIIYANNESSKLNLTKEIAMRGVDPSRLIFGERLDRPEYLARFQTADLFLDTQPYNAGTTASDALRMGLPMLTLKGKSYQARMGASILNALNLPELITNTPREYESLAIELAINSEKLKIIKDKLINNLSTAPLFNTPLFAKNLESAYSKMYERHQKGLESDHIFVE